MPLQLIPINKRPGEAPEVATKFSSSSHIPLGQTHPSWSDPKSRSISEFVFNSIAVTVHSISPQTCGA